MRKKWLFLIPFILIIVAVTAVILYIRPTQELDLNYTELDWKAKITQMIETREPVIQINAEEFNRLAKQKLVKYLAKGELPVDVTGAEFKQHGNRIDADINGKWGIIPFGAKAVYNMDFSGGLVVLTPVSVQIKGIKLTPEQLGLKQVSVPPGKELPEMIKVKDMIFHEDSIEARLSLNWLEIMRLL
ncbi:hypothetical protein EJP77_16190 [Paenibacillus zeisoli]|uniref:DUF2140 family protein n=1 Tax=Paenibacillus zeisoli TaxID=2496267 RepID=A0A3S1B404_9BACL|nr:hypothetical protein [Paenibacillus zeisoli]RUT28945.1 hypothetical protein EJP77_16190 [Paenibacillus zeisoli]